MKPHKERKTENNDLEIWCWGLPKNSDKLDLTLKAV